MSFVAVAIGGSALVGAGVGVYSANKAADAQSKAAGNALSLQKSMFDQSQANLKPYMDAGTGATYSLSKLLGTSPGGSGTPDYSSFYNSPDYAFGQQQGELGIERGANARGLNLSGGTLKDLAQFNSGYATQQYGNYFSRLMGLSQMGANAASGAAGNATTAGGNMGNTIMGQGQAQASGYVGSANAINGAMSSGISNSLLANYLGKSPSAYGGGGSTSTGGALVGYDAAGKMFGG